MLIDVVRLHSRNLPLQLTQLTLVLNLCAITPRDAYTPVSNNQQQVCICAKCLVLLFNFEDFVTNSQGKHDLKVSLFFHGFRTHSSDLKFSPTFSRVLLRSSALSRLYAINKLLPKLHLVMTLLFVLIDTFVL